AVSSLPATSGGDVRSAGGGRRRSHRVPGGIPRAGARDDGAGGRRGVANAEHRGRPAKALEAAAVAGTPSRLTTLRLGLWLVAALLAARQVAVGLTTPRGEDRKSTRLNSSHVKSSS